MSNIKDINTNKQQTWNINWLKNKKQPTPIVQRF